MGRYAYFAVSVLAILLLAAFSYSALDSVNTNVSTPTNNSYLNGTKAITVSFPDTANITIAYWNGTDYLPLNSTTNATSPYVFTWNTSAYPDAANYSLLINVTNSSNITDNLNLSVVNLTIDNTPPNFTAVSPAVNTRVKDSSAIVVNYSVSDALSGLTNGASCTPMIDSGITTFSGSVAYFAAGGTCNGTITLSTPSNLSNGNHQITINMTDIAGNRNTSTSIQIVVDNAGPAVSNFTANATYLRTGASVRLRVNATDNGSIAWLNVSSSTNSSATINLSPVSGILFEVNTTLATFNCNTEGGCLLNITAIDDLGNVNNTIQLNLTLDDTRPAVTNFVANMTVSRTSTNVTFNVTVTDASPLANITVLSAAGTESGFANLTSAGGNVYQANFTLATFTCTEAVACTLNVTVIDAAGNRNNTAQLVIMTDSTAPNVTLNSPANNSYNSSTNVTFNFTAADNTLTTSNTLYIDGVANLTFQGNVSGNTTFAVSLIVTEGTHNWSVTSIDNASNSASTATRIFTIDTSNPAVRNFTSNSSYVSGSASIMLRVNVTDANTLSNVTVGLSDGSGVNLSLTSAGGNMYERNTTATALGCASNGNCTLNITAVDVAGSRNNTVQLTFVVDSAAPNLTLHAPTNNSNITSTSNVTFNFTASDSTVTTNNTLYIDGVANRTLQGNVSGNTTFVVSLVMSEGAHNWSVISVDNASNTNTSETRVFLVDTIRPAVQNFTTNNSYAADSASIRLRVNVTDANSLTNVTAGKTAGDGPNLTLTSAGGNMYERNTTPSELGCTSNGECTLNITATDLLGNINNSVTLVFIVDTNASSLVINNPANNTNFSTRNVSFNFTVADAIGVPNSTLYINGTANQSVQGNSTFNISALFADGFYNWSISSVDNASNTNTSTVRYFIVDATPPNVTGIFSNTTGNNTRNDTIVRINVTVIDAHTILNVTIGNSTSALMNSSGNFYTYTGNVSALGCASGACTLRVAALDNFGHTNNSVVLTMTVSATSPTVSLSSPADTANITNATVNFTWVANSTIDTNLTCVLYVNGTANATVTGNGTLFTAQTISEGAGNWSVTCTDDATTSSSSSTRTFTVDSVSPSPVVLAPLTTQNNSYFPLDLRVVELNPNTTLVVYNLSRNGSGTNVASGSIASALFTTSGVNNTLANTTFFSGVSNGVYNLSITAYDLFGNSVTNRTNFTVTDTTMPNVTATSPSSELSSGTTATTLSATTDENATCHYDTADVNYSLMASAFAETNTTHEASVSVSAGTSYTYYIRCNDTAGNVMNTSTTATFSVAAAAASSGGRRGGGGGGGGGTSSTASLGSNPTTRTVSTSGRISFVVPGDKSTHTITIKKIVNETVTIVIQSTPVEVTLTKGETKDVDITGDGVADVRVSLTSVSASSASFALSTPLAVAPAETAPETPTTVTPEPETTDVTEPEAIAPAMEEQIPQVQPEAIPTAAVEKKSSGKGYLWLLLAAVLAIAIVWLMARKKSPPPIKHQDLPQGFSMELPKQSPHHRK